MDYRKLFEKEPNQVVVEGNSSVKKLVLNRPQKLNSLNIDMVSQLWNALQSFQTNPAIKLVILTGRGKAFCAGGDIVKCIELLSEHWTFTAFFYRKQLMLDYLIGTYKKPLVALINGVVMGGGAGLSMHTKLRVVTDKTVFAMPETSIGMFPDVGASHFLSRLPGFFGEYLGLTGARIDGAEMIACGLATHFVFSKDLLALENALMELENADIFSTTQVIDRFTTKPSFNSNTHLTRLEQINRCFSQNTVEEILLSLDNEVATNREDTWASKAKKSMEAASPTALKLALRSVAQIREGRKQDLAQCLIREYTTASRILHLGGDGDFAEGSRAKILDKDNKPKWNPASLEQVSDEMVDIYFTEPKDDKDWRKLELDDGLSSSPTFTSRI